jgi:hypothetical protein
MSSSEIQALCEIYIGRKFDENDSAALRDFLRDLQVQKPKREAAPKAEKKADDRKFVPVSERKQHYVKEVAPGDRPAPVNLSEFGATAGAKDRAALYAQQVNSNTSVSHSAARVESELGAPTKVSDRKAHWAELADHGGSAAPKESKPVSITDDSGNIVSPRTRDRLVSFESGAVAQRSIDEKELVAQRLAEISGVPAVKDRLGAWNQATNAGGVDEKQLVEERTAELKKATSVRDRLGAYTKAATDSKPIERAPVHIPQDISELPTKDTQGQ